jgi:hypothetical protein
MANDETPMTGLTDKFEDSVICCSNPRGTSKHPAQRSVKAGTQSVNPALPILL